MICVNYPTIQQLNFMDCCQSRRIGAGQGGRWGGGAGGLIQGGKMPYTKPYLIA